MTHSDSETSRSGSPVMSIASTHDAASMHSSISDDSRLNDHRHQNLTLPVRNDTSRRQSVNSAAASPVLIANTNPAKANSDQQQQFPVHPRPVAKRPENMLNSRDLRARMIAVDDGSDDESELYISKLPSEGPARQQLSQQSTSFTLPPPAHRASVASRVRTSSFSDQVKSFIRPKEDSVTGGILLGGTNSNNNGKQSGITISNTLNRTMSRASTKSDRSRKMNRHGSGVTNKDSVESDSDIDSHASRDSQETEEDVCFPMLPEHIRIKGIDFDEIEEFIHDQREENKIILKREEEIRSMAKTTSSQNISSAALKYTPKKIQSGSSSSASISASATEEKVLESSSSSAVDANNVSFKNVGSDFERESSPPDRFSFFSSENEETIHAPDIPSLVKPNQPFKSLFEATDSIWWLDCVCPTDNEMKMLAKAFGIHPLTAEDIRMQETREKVELFKTYYFVCFHSFETDSESEDFLEPINVYIVVFREGILTFHFSPVSHPANVRRRVRQLRDYVNVSADWLCYALIDDITDGFAPVIHSIEYEADAIEDSVFLSRENDFGTMLVKIGESRRKVMTLMRLLQGKADVIKMFAKRCQDEATRPIGSHMNLVSVGATQPRADIALYLGDIQDHIITMFQSLMSYEKIFSRSHSNYLAQLQVESFYSTNQVTEMLSKVTLIGTILVPMNLVTGLFGMNVKVPGGGGSNLNWFGGILGFIIGIVLLSFFLARIYLKRVEQTGGLPSNSSKSIRSFGFGRRRNYDPSRDRTDRSMASLPTKFTRYGGDW